MLTEKQVMDKKLADALKEFNGAYLNLVGTLYDSMGKEGEGHRFDSIAGTHYPFDCSFDELNITDWVEVSLENLKKK